MRSSDKKYITIVQKIDMSHLLSKDQIELVKLCTKSGDIISFQTGDGNKIKGVVVEKFNNVFLLDNGRSYKWIDYILGSPQILRYLKAYHPIEELPEDTEINYYRQRTFV